MRDPAREVLKPELVDGQRHTRLRRRRRRAPDPRRLLGRPPARSRRGRSGVRPRRREYGPGAACTVRRPRARRLEPPATQIAKLSLKPRAFRAGGRGTKVRYTLSAAGRVTLTVTTAKGKRSKGVTTTKGKAGVNTLRFTGRIGSKKLKPGRYRLVLTPAGGSTASVKFTILR